MVIFTNFDAQINNEFAQLAGPDNEDKWKRARKNAERSFQTVYLHKVMNAKHPPKAHVQLEGENNGDVYRECE